MRFRTVAPPDSLAAMLTRVLAFAAALAASPAAGQQHAPGDFDYYLLALSWSPSWCRAEGDDEDAPQCAAGRRTDFVVHGLWPQYERGWPENCATDARDPSRRETAAMADVMGSGGLAWYQWRKHGRCSGLSAAGYFAATRRAAEGIEIPPVFDGLFRDLRLPVAAIEDAFIAVNAGLTRDAITVTCEGGALQEVRICLTRDLRPRDCAPDSRRDCRAARLLMERVR